MNEFHRPNLLLKAVTTIVATNIFFAFFLVTGDISFPILAIATNALLTASAPGTEAIAPSSGVRTRTTTISRSHYSAPIMYPHGFGMGYANR